MLSSPYKAGRRSASPLPPAPPPKAIDLNSSTRSTDRETGHKITRRAFHCDLIVDSEGEVSNLLSHLGQPLQPLSCIPSPVPAPSRTIPGGDELDSSPQKEATVKRLHSLVEELVRTERSYLSRIHALKVNYADPLREFAKDRNTQIIPLYEAKNLFANIDQVVPSSAAFLADLEAMWAAGQGAETVGDLCLRHLKELPTFAPYRTYLSKHDEVQRLFQETLKKYSGFNTYIDSTKYRTTGIGNIGLRELLMEPVQRIPRYTLLWQTMIKCMPAMSRQRAQLAEAVEIASRIAKCEPDAQTIRATVMYCLQRHVEDFPADLFSSKRDYIDSLDVDDVPTDYHYASRSSTRPTSTLSSISTSTPSLASIGSSASSSMMPASPPPHMPALSTLHCTLFLLDDKLLIVKRQAASVSGRKVTGLDDVARLVKSGGGIAVMDKGARKDKLVYRGCVDVLEVIASDVGNGDFHLFFERPPLDQSERWSGRPFRAYSAVNPPYQGTLDVGLRKDKGRFLQNLWTAQAMARAKLLPKELEPPRALESDYEAGLDGAGEMFGRAKCFWTVWNAKSWNQAPRKAKVVVLVDESDHLPEPALHEDGPCMGIRLQPLSGGLCRFSYTTVGDADDEREVIDMADIADKVATTTTPSATSRLRPSMLNLDAISRNLFGAASVSSRSHTSSNSGDMFGTAMSRRSMAISHSTIASTSSDERRILSRMSSSPDCSADEKTPVRAGSPYKANAGAGQSEIDLHERLNLARRNSKSMAALSPRSSKRVAQRSMGELRSRGRSEEAMDSIEDQLLGAAPLGNPVPYPVPRTAPLHIRNKTPSPTRALARATPELPMIPITSPLDIKSLPMAMSPREMGSPQPISPRHPKSPLMGPRSPGLPAARAAPPQGPRSIGPRSLPGAPSVPAPTAPIPIGIGSAHTRLRVVSGNGRRVSLGRETIPLKGCSPEVRPSSAMDTTPTMLAKRQHSEDHLTPRKRSPTRSPLEPRQADQTQVGDALSVSTGKSPRRSPIGLGNPGSRRSSGARTPRHLTPRKTSAASVASTATVRSAGPPTEAGSAADHADISSALDAAKQKITDAQNAAKRIRTDVTSLRKQAANVVRTGSSAGSMPRSPQRRDMRRLLDLEPVSDFASPPRLGKVELDQGFSEEKLRNVLNVAAKLERSLQGALGDLEGGRSVAEVLVAEGVQRTLEISRLEIALEQGREERELLRQQLADSQVEVDTIYEAFNSELDGMFSDAQLPETEAWQALQDDLARAKEERNALKLENMRLARELGEVRLGRDQMAKMLATQHGD